MFLIVFHEHLALVGREGTFIEENKLNIKIHMTPRLEGTVAWDGF
jgi:hypothetical protein